MLMPLGTTQDDKAFREISFGIQKCFLGFQEQSGQELTGKEIPGQSLTIPKIKAQILAYKRVMHKFEVAGTFSTVVSLSVWLAAAHGVAGLQLPIELSTFFYILESVALAGCVFSLVSAVCLLHLNSKVSRLEKEREAFECRVAQTFLDANYQGQYVWLNESCLRSSQEASALRLHDKRRKEEILLRAQLGLGVAGSAILLISQLWVVLDCWTGAGMVEHFRSGLGLAFDGQAIFDTLGLSFILLSFFCSVAHEIATRNNRKELCDTYNSAGQAHQPRIISNDALPKATSVGSVLRARAVPFVGLALIVLGKIVIGLQGCKAIDLGMSNGCAFPLGLALRIVGAFILIGFGLHSLTGKLDKAEAYELSGAATLSLGAAAATA